MIKILLVLTIVGFIASCGGDDEVDELDELYSELVGTYDLFRAEVTFVNEPSQIFEPPDAEGTITITSDRRIIQDIVFFGESVSIKSSFEINLDESKLIINTDGIDLVSESIFTWNGDILITTDIGIFTEKDFWRKR